MSTGHPNRRRSGSPRPRHGPQKQDRPERQPGRTTAALVANTPAQPSQEHPKTGRERTSEQPARHPRVSVSPTLPAPVAPIAPIVPIARRKGALRTASAEPHASDNLPANNHNHSATPPPEADVSGIGSMGIAPATQPTPPTHTTHHQTVVVRAYEAHEAHEIHEKHEAHTIVADVSAHIVIGHEVNEQEPVANTTPSGEAPGANTPRQRMSRFYAPGLRFRPDESWVEQAPPHGVSAESERPVISPRTQAPEPFGEHGEHIEYIEHPRPRDELGRLIDSLHALFEHDRSVASQTGAVRCGVCYLHFPMDELEYRDEEGFYICPSCRRSLGGAHIPMVRRQQK